MIELIAVIFSLISVMLTIKVSKYCWYFGIIGVIFYMIVFYQSKLWGNFGLQFIFLLQNIIGIINWSINDIKKVSYVNNRWKLIFPPIFLYPIFFIISKNSSMPICDSIITLFSIIATYLLIYKKIESWIYWLIVDIISVYMFYKSELYLSTALYFIFMITATIGLINWVKLEKNEKV